LTDIGAYFQFASGPVTVDIEYCGATTREKNKPKPSAYSVGLAYQASEPLELAVRYDSLNDDDDSSKSPKSRIGVGINYTILEDACLSVEYADQRSEDGHGTPSYAIKLAIEF
jgi:predicted porin